MRARAGPETATGAPGVRRGAVRARWRVFGGVLGWGLWGRQGGDDGSSSPESGDDEFLFSFIHLSEQSRNHFTLPMPMSCLRSILLRNRN